MSGCHWWRRFPWAAATAAGTWCASRWGPTGRLLRAATITAVAAGAAAVVMAAAMVGVVVMATGGPTLLHHRTLYLAGPLRSVRTRTTSALSRRPSGASVGRQMRAAPTTRRLRGTWAPSPRVVVGRSCAARRRRGRWWRIGRGRGVRPRLGGLASRQTAGWWPRPTAAVSGQRPPRLAPRGGVVGHGRRARSPTSSRASRAASSTWMAGGRGRGGAPTR